MTGVQTCALPISNNEILVRIEQYLYDVIPQYIECSPVRKSKKVQVVNKLIGVDDSKGFDELMSFSYKKLSELWAEASKTKCPVPYLSTESKYLAYMDSLTRFISYGGERTSILKSLRKIMVIGYMALERVEQSETYNKYFYVKYECLIVQKYCQAILRNPDDWPEFKDLLYNAAFETLQGGTQIGRAHV